MFKITCCPNSHGLSYFLFSGWTTKFNTEQGDFEVKINSIVKVNQHIVNLFGTCEDKVYKATVNVNPHCNEHCTGTMLWL